MLLSLEAALQAAKRHLELFHNVTLQIGEQYSDRRCLSAPEYSSQTCGESSDWGWDFGEYQVSWQSPDRQDPVSSFRLRCVEGTLLARLDTTIYYRDSRRQLKQRTLLWLLELRTPNG